MKNGRKKPKRENKTNLDLKERVKELDCLYRVSDILSESTAPSSEILQKIVNILPEAFQHPEVTCARIKYNSYLFRTKKFISTSWFFSTRIIVNGSVVGLIEIFLMTEREKKDHGPFLKEEKKLLDEIGQRLSKYLEGTHTDMELKRYQEMIKGISKRSSRGENGDGVVKTEEEWKIILKVLLKTDPSTLFMITRKMIYYLSHYKDISFEKIMAVLRPVDSRDSEWYGINIPNPKSDIEALDRVVESIYDIAKEKLGPREILDLITLWLKQAKTRPLLLASEMPNITRSEITDLLNQYVNVPFSERFLSYEDGMAIRTNLIRRLLTSRLEFINIGKKYFHVEDFAKLMGSVIGPSNGVGTLGGKASGIILAEKIIRKARMSNPDLEPVDFARTWYVSSDTMRDFINYNTLEEVVHIKYLEPTEIRNDQPFLEQMFKNGVFPQEIITGLKDILRETENSPLIVRSSSHLEDSFGASFSGKYKSLFITNQGAFDERLKALENAISEVWASTFNPNAIQYRKAKGMLDLIEYMGIMIQEVVGTRMGPYFFPPYAGVGLSNNEFRWSPRIRRKDSILRLVVGLGTRAVDRVADDYPTLISPLKPQLRANSLANEAVQYSQRNMDVINLEKNILETVPVSSIIKEHGGNFSMIRSIFSIYRDGTLSTPSTALMDTTKDDLIVTFKGFDEKHPHLKCMIAVMELLKKELDFPVDIEFASDGKRLTILQCRPQIEADKIEATPPPKDIKDHMKLFTASRYVTSCSLRNIDYIVYVDAEGYEKLTSKEEMTNVAKLVGELNANLPRRKFILMGPGRWGSRGDIKLGVPVEYQDINNTSLLVEIARRKGGYLPELSFGTHFFQDLVESNIMYLPLYPDEDDSSLNMGLLFGPDNHLDTFVSSTKGLEKVVKVIKVSETSDGGTLSVYMDGDRSEAVAYLKPPDHSKWRYDKIEQMLGSFEPEKFGVVDIYLTGSTKDWKAGPGSDIDLIVHFRGKRDQKEDLLAWFEEWSQKLDLENRDRTGHLTGGLLDIHIITDEDIMERSSWAVHLDSIDGKAQKLDLRINEN